MKLTEAEIWFNPKVLEPYLKKIGLDFPKYPKEGDVLYKGKKVGHMSNFNGFSVYSKSLLKQLQKVEKKYKLGIWNPTSGLTMEGKLREIIREEINSINEESAYKTATNNELAMYLTQLSNTINGTKDKKMLKLLKRTKKEVGDELSSRKK